MVKARPIPTIKFGRSDGKDLIINTHKYGDEKYLDLGENTRGSRYNLYLRPSHSPLQEVQDTFEAVLEISGYNESDAGDFFCDAENTMGNVRKTFNVTYSEFDPLPRHQVSVFPAGPMRVRVLY